MIRDADRFVIFKTNRYNLINLNKKLKKSTRKPALYNTLKDLKVYFCPRL